MFFIIQCKLKILISILIFTFYNTNQMYLIILHPTPLVTLIKWNNVHVFVKEVLEQPRSKTRVHNVTIIYELRHATPIKKASYWLTLTLLHLEARSRSHDFSMFCIEKCKQLEMLDSCKATTLRM